MRALTSGYYPELKAMYDFLGIRCRTQNLRFIFTEQPGQLSDDQVGEAYFVHASNNHQFPPPRPPRLGISQYLLELGFVTICYLWFTLCCFVVEPQRSIATGLPESVKEYLRRIWIPERFAGLYLLPLISAVATCSHHELLDFPASDLVNYRKAILFGEHLVVTEGVQRVQEHLANRLDIHTSSPVTKVVPVGSKIKLTVQGKGSVGGDDLVFDRVVLAVPPNVVAAVYEPLRDQLGCIPTKAVTTVIHRSSAHDDRSRAGAENIYLCTSRKSDGWTHASHHHGGGICVTSNCGGGPILTGSLSTSSFTRTLRTSASKNVVDQIFKHAEGRQNYQEKTSAWTNGQDGVYLTGAWCWDGMVLLEGAAVSAVRVAEAFSVQIPWRKTSAVL